MKIDKNIERWFKSNPLPLSFSPEQIDEENGIISDVVVCEVGQAKGHGVSLELSFIEKLVNYCVTHFSSAGLKARFGHPSMSDSTMGAQLGHFKNFRVRDNQAIADLHLLASAELSPTKPGMRSWMLSMAKEATDFVMSSIVFSEKALYQYDDEGTRVIIERDDWGEFTAAYADKEVFVEFNQIHYTDMVEAGAATNSLFSQQFNRDKFAVQAVEFVQDNPELHKFLKANPAKLVEFCKPLGIVLPTSNKFSTKLTEVFFGKDKPEDENTFSDELKAQFKKEIDEAKSQFAQFKTSNAQTVKELTERAEKAEKELKAANEKIEEWGELIPKPPTQLKPGQQEPPVAPEKETKFAASLRAKSEKYIIKD